MPSEPNLPQVGETILGKYRIDRVIAEGGMGVVYEAVHKRLGQHFALKVLYPKYSSNPDLMQRFDLEGRIASRLEGPNLARVYDIDTLPNGSLFMVMELLNGHDLEKEFQTRKVLPPDFVADIVTQAANGMREAHSNGVVHRDLKPANIFLCRVPGTSRPLVKVLDFGISRMMHDSQKRVTADFAMLGTALYMSPEQIKSASDVDGRTDIWALGVMMYELLTGSPPFDGAVTEVLVQVATAVIRRPSTLRPDLPPGLDDVIMRCLERDRARRFQSMDEVMAALTPWAPKEGIEALLQRMPPPNSPPTLTSGSSIDLDIALVDFNPTSRKKAVVIGTIFGIAAIIGVILIVLSLSAPSGKPELSNLAVKPPETAAAPPPPPSVVAPPPTPEPPPAVASSTPPVVHPPAAAKPTGKKAAAPPQPSAPAPVPPPAPAHPSNPRRL